MLLASYQQLDRPATAPKHLMAATITMPATPADSPVLSGARAGHRKRHSGASPPPFSFPAAPISLDDSQAPVTPPAQTPAQFEASALDKHVDRNDDNHNHHHHHHHHHNHYSSPVFDPDVAPPGLAVISSTPPDSASTRYTPAALPAFSFGAGSEAPASSVCTDAPAPSARRRHMHKRSTTQNIDVSSLDLRPHSAYTEPTSPASASGDEARPATTAPAHKLTFGPSAQMESQPTPPSSRGSSVRFSDPPPVPAFNRDRLFPPEQDSESALIDLDMAVVDAPPSPRARKGRRAGSMHSGGNRILINQPLEGHRRTESAPQLAPAFLLDTSFTRRQSMTPSTMFPLGDVFEEDEDPEPRHDAPDMTDSALPSPQTTLATPRLDTANSSALSFGAQSAATTSDGNYTRRPLSRRKKFGRKLLFWKWKSTSETSLACDTKSN